MAPAHQTDHPAHRPDADGPERRGGLLRARGRTSSAESERTGATLHDAVSVTPKTSL